MKNLINCIDRVNWCNYKLYCKVKGIPEGDFRSLEKWVNNAN